jgi:DNA replication initiation complex subunit (GINS family)
MSDEATYQQLRDAIEDLEKNIGRYDKGSCEITVLEVLKDKQVQMAFIKEYVSHENIFRVSAVKVNTTKLR